MKKIALATGVLLLLFILGYVIWSAATNDTTNVSLETRSIQTTSLPIGERKTGGTKCEKPEGKYAVIKGKVVETAIDIDGSYTLELLPDASETFVEYKLDQKTFNEIQNLSAGTQITLYTYDKTNSLYSCMEKLE